MKNTVELRTAHNYDVDKASDDTGIDTRYYPGTKKKLSDADQGGAKQSFKEECDINTIVKRFGIGYELPIGLRQPQYGDFVGINNYHQAMNAISEANSTFNQLDADTRARFHNDPGEFVDFCLDETNREELADLGFLSETATKAVHDAKAQRNAPPEGGDSQPQAKGKHARQDKPAGGDPQQKDK